ncbi:tRNA N6-adenosine threonylcarbamoyltransferase [Desulfovibrionales bacterium]
MLCLGIETSCDETSLALVRHSSNGAQLLAEVIATQKDAHALFGGVVPELASREHCRALPALLDRLLAFPAIAGQGITARSIDVVAVVRGPGLIGSLLVGLSFAKGLALALGAQLVGVNHLYAHLLASGLETTLHFPALGLLISGGHTHLYRMDSPTAFTIMGRTIDDACGEAFDKVAKMLNLPYPGGQFIDWIAAGAEPDIELFTRPYLDNQNLDFSFSGLKTAVANYLAKHPELRLSVMPDLQAVKCEPDRFAPLAHLCASFTWTVADTLRIKTDRALTRMPDVRALVVAGGVAVNRHIRRTMARTAASSGLLCIMPSPTLCTDNGSMVAYAGGLLA